MKRFREAKGTGRETQGRCELRKTMEKARRDSCEQEVSRLEKRCKEMGEAKKRQINAEIKKHLRPKEKTAEVMKVGQEILGKNEVEQMWPAFFHA